MGEPNVNYNSKSKRATIRGSKKEEKAWQDGVKIAAAQGGMVQEKNEMRFACAGGLPSVISII